jgi:phosphoglycerate kinase
MDDIKKLTDFNLKGKKVLLRVDLNVPIAHGKIVDTARIERIIPTINYLLENEAKVILLSHFGRPKGKFVLEMSLAPIVDALNKFLPKDKQAKFAIDCIGEDAQNAVNQLKNSEILLLENLRFYAGEEDNDPEFIKSLAELGDIFINDTFSCSHRNHSSIVGLANILPCGIGKLFISEIENISKILKKPVSPIMSIIGGSKVSSKISLLRSLVEKSDFLVIGGGMANTFLKSQKYNIGTSLYEQDFIKEAQEIIKLAKKYNCEIILPQDVVIARHLQEFTDCEIVDKSKISRDKMVLDLGPETCLTIINKLSICKTVIWNGPLGAFEYRPFNIATEMVARKVAYYSKAKKLSSIAGGGDVVAALKNAGLRDNFSYLSTAGGAFLEWLKGEIIPGIKALTNKK